jgi:hypothetical protein
LSSGRLESLSLSTGHGALEILGFLGAQELQAHLPLLLILVRVLLLHLLDLVPLASRELLRAAFSRLVLGVRITFLLFA